MVNVSVLESDINSLRKYFNDTFGEYSNYPERYQKLSNDDLVHYAFIMAVGVLDDQKEKMEAEKKAATAAKRHERYMLEKEKKQKNI